MAGVPQYTDISAWQGAIDWVAYCKWASQWDGIARVAMKSTEGVGFTDPRFQANRAGALAAGIDVIIFYHYARPNINSAIAEADWQHQVVGAIRSNDVLMLDYEENVPQANAEWAYEWLSQQEKNYSGKLPTLYASSSYIKERLQDSRLATYPLTMADWQFSPDERPVCPLPWKSYEYLQYTDRAANIPGIAGTVDADLFLGGGSSMANVPKGWADDGKTLTAPNGIKVVLGFREHILSHKWDPADVPLAPEAGANPVEIGETQPGTDQSGTRLITMYSELCYTKARGVWNATVGRELWTLLNEKLPNTPAPVPAPTATSTGSEPAATTETEETEAQRIKRDLLAAARMIGDTATHLLSQAKKL